MHRLETRQENSDTWKDLMRAHLMSAEISQDAGERNLSPRLVMNERHKMARNNTRINHFKLFPLPKELKFVEAKKLIREENLQKLIMEKEERIAKKALVRLEQSFANHRDTVNSSLNNMEKHSKGNLDLKRSVGQAHMQRLHECSQILKNIKKIYESVHQDIQSNNDKRCGKLPKKQAGCEKLRKVTIPDENILKIENQGLPAVRSQSTHSSPKIEERKLNTTPREITPPEESQKEIEEVVVTVQTSENCNDVKVKVMEKFECKLNLLYYWKVWRKFVWRVNLDKKRKIIMVNKIDTFLGRLTNTAAERKPCKIEPKKRPISRKREMKSSESNTELDQIETELKNSAIETYDSLQKNLKNFHPKLQPKVKALSTFPPVQRRLADVEKKVYPVPEFLIRMENRYKERKQRWENIQKKKDELQAEKEKIEREREEERLRIEELKKREKLEEILERRRLRKEAEEKRNREREFIRQQIKLAQQHYTRYLMRRIGFNPWLSLIRNRQRLMEEAAELSEVMVLKKCLTYWRQYTSEQLKIKYEQADQVYNSILLRNTLRTLIIDYNESIKKFQSAVDWADAKLLEKAFENWLEWTRQERRELVRKEEIANSFYGRKLLKKWFIQWTYFPEYMKNEKEKEKRKRVWQRKVQEFLPDYQPSYVSEI
ncbi:UNVERIFIED_CONTAM: hypothetical protein PYX00_009769 [Menopon gallinae]|uniref:Uncharacterized protein n=1 Tax=Menopon gallinae TaxID=328185 RepID=A0AAW2HCV8_9NEOP